MESICQKENILYGAMAQIIVTKPAKYAYQTELFLKLLKHVFLAFESIYTLAIDFTWQTIPRYPQAKYQSTLLPQQQIPSEVSA